MMVKQNYKHRGKLERPHCSPSLGIIGLFKENHHLYMALIQISEVL